MNHANMAEYEASKTARKLAEDTFNRQEQAEQRRQLKTILDWLESADQENDQDRYTGVRTECKDSGQWLMKDPKVKSWFEPNFSCPNLWLRGIPGVGMPSTSLNVSGLLTRYIIKGKQCLHL